MQISMFFFRGDDNQYTSSCRFSCSHGQHGVMDKLAAKTCTGWCISRLRAISFYRHTSERQEQSGNRRTVIEAKEMVGVILLCKQITSMMQLRYPKVIQSFEEN